MARPEEGRESRQNPSELSDSNRPKKIKLSPLDEEVDAGESDSDSEHENGQEGDFTDLLAADYLNYEYRC